MSEPITDAWLRDCGFKWHQFDRQPEKHWVLWLRTEAASDELGIEIAAGAWNGRDHGDWFCWLRSDVAGRYHRFLHVRHVKTAQEVVALVEAITGQPWDTANHWYGSVLDPKGAELARKECERLDLRMLRETPAALGWSESEKDPDRGRALREHLDEAIKARGAK